MAARRTSVVSLLNLTEAEEVRLLEEIDDLPDGENIYLEICEEESKNFTSLTTFHGMIRIFLSRTWISLTFWVLVVCTCLVFYMVFSGQLLINYSKAVTFQKISSLSCQKPFLSLVLCNVRLANSYTNESQKCITERISLTNNKIRIELRKIALDAFISLEEFERIPLRAAHSHFLFMEPSQILRLNSTRSRCENDWNELHWAHKAPNLTYSYKNCEITKRKLLVTTIRLNANDFPCFPSCSEVRHRRTFSSMKNRQNSSYLTIEYGGNVVVYEETRKMTIVDVLSLIGGGTSLFLGCSCVTLMETFVFLFKLVVQGLTKDVPEDIPDKPAQPERIATEDIPFIMSPETKTKFDLKHRRKSTLVHIYMSRRHPSCEVDGIMSGDNSTSLPDDANEKLHPSPDKNVNIIDDEENLSKSTNQTFERIFPRLKRQPALDVPDEIGDQNSRVQSQPSFILDDFTSARGNLRRASSTTSKTSNTSRARSLKLLGQVPQKRRSQIFSKHLLMNDF